VTRVAFLVDEGVPAAVANAVLALEPAVRLRVVGTSPDVPPKGTPDPALLVFAEDEGFAIVTFDKDTMPGHAADHTAAGRYTSGVFVFPRGNDLSAGRVADELVMIWGASAADEWTDLTVFLPM
jgi:hypothetical protein